MERTIVLADGRIVNAPPKQETKLAIARTVEPMDRPKTFSQWCNFLADVYRGRQVRESNEVRIKHYL